MKNFSKKLRFFFALWVAVSSSISFSSYLGKVIQNSGLLLVHATSRSHVVPILQKQILDTAHAQQILSNGCDIRGNVFLMLTPKETFEQFLSKEYLNKQLQQYAFFSYKPEILDSIESFHMTNAFSHGLFIDSPISALSNHDVVSVSGDNRIDVLRMIDYIRMLDCSNEVVIPHNVPTNKETLKSLYYQGNKEEMDMVMSALNQMVEDN